MALNHFASQIKNTQPEQVIVSSKPVDQPAKQSKLAQLETLKANKTAPKLGKAPVRKEAPTQTATETEIQNETNVNPALKEIPLTWSDQQMLCALSAMQIRYGRAAEAIPYLMMIRKINPGNTECARLLALAFMRLNRWQEAEAMVEEFDYLQNASQGSPINGIVLLYRSLVSFKTNRIADAKSWFGKFRTFNKA